MGGRGPGRASSHWMDWGPMTSAAPVLGLTRTASARVGEPGWPAAVCWTTWTGRPSRLRAEIRSLSESYVITSAWIVVFLAVAYASSQALRKFRAGEVSGVPGEGGSVTTR